MDLYDYILPQINNKIVFDIGANVGKVTEILKKGNPLKIISVEPNEHLTKNDNFNDVVVVNKCVSDTNSGIIFYKCSTSTISTCEERWKKDHYNSEYTIVKKESITLDDLINKYGKPYYIKIDVEGHEDKVLQGLSFKIDLISFEYTYSYKDVFTSCVNKLSSFNFKKALTFLKKKEKKKIDGKLKTVRIYYILNEFYDRESILLYFDTLIKNDQGDILFFF